MGLNAPTPGLRVINSSKSPIHTSVVIPVGDELEVSEYVGNQLVAEGLKKAASGVKLVTGPDPGSDEALAKVSGAAKKAAARPAKKAAAKK